MTYYGVVAALALTIRRVAGAKTIAADRGNSYRYLTQGELSRRANISRSTLTKQLKSANAGNPTLKSICSIADALGVPPALLLMREHDWKVLGSAMEFYGKINNSEELMATLSNIIAALDHGPSASAERGRALARLTGYLPRLAPGAPSMVYENVSMQEQRIGALCAMPPLAKLHKERPSQIPLLLLICVALGANFRE